MCLRFLRDLCSKCENIITANPLKEKKLICLIHIYFLKFNADGVGVIQIAFYCSNWFLTLQNENWSIYRRKNIKIYDAFPICNVLLWVFLILFILYHLYLAISQIMSCIIITACFYLVFVFILPNIAILYIMLILILVDSLLLLLWHCRLAAINRCRWQ